MPTNIVVAAMRPIKIINETVEFYMYLHIQYNNEFHTRLFKMHSNLAVTKLIPVVLNAFITVQTFPVGNSW